MRFVSKMKLRFIILGLFLLGIDVTVGSGDIRSSLTFVIDDTGSMEDDINEVKIGAKAIFDTVMNSNSSQIEDYVLVTINDPTFKLRKKTKDANAFKEVLNALKIDRGPENMDCPELSMSGIELALQSSRDGSSLYVFTDASSKDYKKYDEVEELSQKMGCQIIFVLTGMCSSSARTEPEYLVYQNLAKATNGQVFHLEKYEIGKILEYVKYNIESRKQILASKSFPGGHATFDIPVDADTKELVIAVSGKSPSVSVTDSGGTKWPTTDMTRLREVAVVKVNGVTPDVYKVEVGGVGNTRVVVSGSTSIHFQHGFSIVAPSAITDTVRRPVPGEKSYLSIQLATEGGEVELRSVQILDMNDNVIVEKPLNLVDKTEQFYIATEQIIPPGHIFKIAIKAYDVNTKTLLTRISLTPVKPQEFKIDTVKNKAPMVACKTTATATYGKSLQLKCRISGFPKPSVTWESNDKSAAFSHFETTLELPYDYISYLEIVNVKSNATYSCKADNSAGNDHKSIIVETKMVNYFKILAAPNDTTIEYQKPGEIPCKVEAYPPATVSWYKNGYPLKPDGNIQLSANDSILTIRSMEPYLADNYKCEARNSVGKSDFQFKINISGVEAPEINKTSTPIVAVSNSRADIRCQVIKGTPTPTIRWYFKELAASEFRSIFEITETLHFDKVDAAKAGTYRCIAENIVDWDNEEYSLVVEYMPAISKHYKPNVTKTQGDTVILKCPADGKPTPDITWKFNGAPIRGSARQIISSDGYLGFSASPSDEGEYECEARNSHGAVRINIQLVIDGPIDIESPKVNVIKQMEGLPVKMACRAGGHPKPRITWLYRSKDGAIEYEPTDRTGRLKFDSIQLAQSGKYTCVATNSRDSKNITYIVSVLAPPSIQYTTKEFKSVAGDRQLQIPCNATGNPKPSITWIFGGSVLEPGNKWYNISEDGTLTIKNIGIDSAGLYKCEALNDHGKTEEDFNVIVNEYSDTPFLSNEVKLEEGTSAIIPCSVPQKKNDNLQWFKDGELISSSELELHHVTESEAGTYTCRVSSIGQPARRASTKVEVGWKPRFTTDSKKNTAFVSGEKAVMDCTAIGVPEPEVKWYYGGTEISFNEYKYEFQMSSDKDRGSYTCVVNNIYGTVQRDFVVSSFQCLLDVENGITGIKPVILLPDNKQPHFKISSGIMYIPKDESIKFICPSNFNTIPLKEITLTCENEFEFVDKSSGTRYVYADLKCADNYKQAKQTSFKGTGHQCSKGNSEMLKIGFETSGIFQEVYEICLDKTSNKTIYTKLNVQSPLSNFAVTNDTEYHGPPVDLDSMYDCSSQNAGISTILDREFHGDGCCFARRMLVNPLDVAPGSQATTYTHLNVAPHWGTCNTKNWEAVERRIRDLVSSSNRTLQVWTGTAGDLQLPDTRSEQKNIVLDGSIKSVQVPRFFWKVVQDPYTAASLVVIQVNVPDLKLAEARKYMMCTDVCKQAKWLRGGHWREVNFGFTYCCRLVDFQRSFGYDDVFPNYDKLLIAV